MKTYTEQELAAYMAGNAQMVKLLDHIVNMELEIESLQDEMDQLMKDMQAAEWKASK